MAPSAAPHARASRNTTGPAGRMCGRGRGPRRVLAGGHWIYQQTRSDGAGIPENMQYPALSPEIQTCLDSTRTEAIIQAQANEGSREGVTATPTLKLSDNQSGHTLVLPGPVEGDALLSALDLLSSDGDTGQGKNAGTPDDGAGNAPR